MTEKGALIFDTWTLLWPLFSVGMGSYDPLSWIPQGALIMLPHAFPNFVGVWVTGDGLQGELGSETCSMVLINVHGRVWI